MKSNHRKTPTTFGFAFCTALLAALAESPPSVADVSVNVGVSIHAESDFYEPLTPHGEWVVVGSYGRCWRPARVERDWRPYCNGHWRHCDGGWYWVSEEPWGWATYHYGRWDMNAEVGWFWVPQIVWAPAWVSWHHGGGYVGWAPLSPSGSVEVTFIGPRVVFVEERRFLEPVRHKTVIVNNTTIINKTVNISKTKVVNKTVINEGPQAEVIEKASGKKIQTVQVAELRQKEEAAVVVKQRAPKETHEKKEKSVQTPAPSEAEPSEKKAAPTKEQRPVEKPAATPSATEAPATKKQEPQNEKGKSEAKPQAEQPSKSEAMPEPKHEGKKEAKPDAEKPNKQEGKPESKPEGKADAEKHGKKQDKSDKESEKQGEVQPAPPEK